ncbi:hypothetical protein HYN59_04600 [Flavobacterium album]|uniref:Uncharacterized protein n=1 Tax=Flavobacterium album TaxID=2175091 RepID=A0A2S1QVS0_9FLAO|nr:hypothetical protein [Flavobacterium album]AWH84439.1 hypothetical protein HYN59_04600 [Flavobacterium album]
MANQTNNDPNNEIDLSRVSAKVKGYFTRANDSFFDGILFIRRNIILIAVIILVGAGLGYYMDKGPKIYSNKVIVHPNFQSVDYLYTAVEDINLKIQQKDTLFLKSIGIREPKRFLKIKIEPIIDIYNFMNQSDNDVKEDRDRKMEIFKLIADNGDMKEVLKDPTTSKNYDNHLIEIILKDKTKQSEVVDPVMAYLNSNPYFKKIQKEQINNVNSKLAANDSIIRQADKILNYIVDPRKSPGASTMYYSDNSQIGEVLQFKNGILSEQAKLRIRKADYDTIFKDRGILLNERARDITSGNMKFIIPVLLLICFIIFVLFRSYYRSQVAKRKIVITG